jgi:hypothetical protein
MHPRPKYYSKQRCIVPDGNCCSSWSNAAHKSRPEHCSKYLCASYMLHSPQSAFCSTNSADTQLRPCGHVFHGRCLKPSLQNTSGPPIHVECHFSRYNCCGRFNLGRDNIVVRYLILKTEEKVARVVVEDSAKVSIKWWELRRWLFLVRSLHFDCIFILSYSIWSSTKLYTFSSVQVVWLHIFVWIALVHFLANEEWDSTSPENLHYVALETTIYYIFNTISSLFKTDIILSTSVHCFKTLTC